MAEPHFRLPVFPSHPQKAHTVPALALTFFHFLFSPMIKLQLDLEVGTPIAPGSLTGRRRSPGGLIKSPFPHRAIRRTSPTVRLACSHVCSGLPGSCLYALALKGHTASAWGGKSSACGEPRAAASRGDSTDRSKANV